MSTGLVLKVSSAGIERRHLALDERGFIDGSAIKAAIGADIVQPVRLAALARTEVVGWVDDAGHVIGRPVEFRLDGRLYRGGHPIAGPMIITRRLPAPHGWPIPILEEHAWLLAFDRQTYTLAPARRHPQAGIR